MNLHKLSLKLSSSKSSKQKLNGSHSGSENSLYIKSKKEDEISETKDLLYKRIKLDSNVLLDINIESPPCTMYGTTINSTGALLSGLLNIIVLEDDNMQSTDSDNMLIKINSVELKFVQRTKYSRPFKNGSEPICSCKDCNIKDLELIHWDILTPEKSTTVTKGSYSYPFSQLLSGKLPQTCKFNNQTGVSYELRGFLKYQKLSDNQPAKEKEVVIVLPIQITHAILRGNDKNSVRIFPPTSITASCTLPNVVYPKSSFPLEIRLEGISHGNKRWRMRSLNWKIEERIKMRQYSCDMHREDLRNLEKMERERIQEEKNLNVNQQRNKAGRNSISQKKNAMNGAIVNNIIIDDNVDELFTMPLAGNGETEVADSNTADNDENEVTNNEVNDGIHNNNSLLRSIPANTSYNLYSNQIPTLSNLDPSSDFRGLVHPNDYQLRQELIRIQQVQRQWQIQQEKNKDCSLYTEEIRVLDHNTIKSGWKSDFNAPLNNMKDDKKSSDIFGAIELITDIDCMSLSSGIFAIKKAASTQFPQDLQKYINYVDKRPAKLTCDIEDPILGLYVSHILVVEIVVAEEILQQYNGAPIVNGLKSVSSNSSTASSQSIGGNNKKIVTVPTGAARVLRMQFRLNFTERSGMGIPWDDEVPPFYEDIKYLSPPNYGNAVAKTLNYDDLFLNMRKAQSEELRLVEEESEEEDLEQGDNGKSGLFERKQSEDFLDEDPNVFPVQSINGNILGSADMLLSPSNSSAQFDNRNRMSNVFNSTQ